MTGTTDLTQHVGGELNAIAAATPTLDDAVVVSLLADRYRIRATSVDRLGGEADLNLRITSESDETFVLKVAPHLRPDAALEFETALARHLTDRLATTDPQLALPCPVPDVDGRFIVSVAEGDTSHRARLLRWVDGIAVADLAYKSPSLLRQIGTASARLTAALTDFDHPGVPAEHHWDMRGAADRIRALLPRTDLGDRSALVENILAWHDAAVPRLLDGLQIGVVHQDLNDFNVLATWTPAGFAVAGVIDLGDTLRTALVTDLAVAVAYAMLREPHPLTAARHVVRGYCDVRPLSEDEAAVVLPLAAVRLCLNAVTWAYRSAREPDNDYARSRSAATWPAIEAVASVDHGIATATVRAAAGFEPHPRRDAALAWLAAQPVRPILSPETDVAWLDLSPEGGDAAAPGEGTAIPLSRHGEARHDRRGRRRPGSDGPATIHLGVDVALPAGTTIHAPLAGVVERAVDDAVLLRHDIGAGTIYTYYLGLTPAAVGSVRAGDPLGTTSADTVHVQLTLALGPEGVPPAFAQPADRDLWLSACPDPSALIRTHLTGPPPPPDSPLVAQLRASHLAASQRSYYREPPLMVRAQDVEFVDEHAQTYLDCINNVTHVGHGQPDVVTAASHQLGTLNTNSRFLYRGLATYAERFAALFPPPLDTAFFVCTGSEANDLALRIARTATGRDHVLVIDGAYHGNTTAVTDISPDRYKRRPNWTVPPLTRPVLQPNRYRGPYGYDHPDAGTAYADDVTAKVRTLVDEGTPPAAFIAETLMGTAGQIVHPSGYLATAFAEVRAAGGLCIVDEVQLGFARHGEHWWYFQEHGVVPDIVTVGKPIANGFPMAAVITSAEIAAAFDNGPKYFNTFGGNPVACAAAHAVLDVIERDGLQANAADVGRHLLARLQSLAATHELIGDVRGRGLYLGVELVRDRATKEPASIEASAISERLKDLGIVMYPNGEFDNILKIKPPMTFRRDDADELVDALDRVLRERW